MDKTQTPPGRDGGDEDAGKKEYYGKPVKAKDAADDAEKELNKAMDNAHKNKARKMYELADRLSKVDTSKLNEQQLVEHTGMIKRLGEELKAMRGVAEGFKNTYSVGDRVDGPLGTGTIVAVSPNINVDGEIKVKLDDPARAGEDGKERDTFVLNTTQVKHIADELEYAMSGMEEAAEDLHTSYNVVKMGGALEVDPRSLRMAIARSMHGKPTRSDTMILSTAFINLLKNSDDNSIQKFANLIKAGNPRNVPQESTAAVAEANAFVDAMRQVKKGEEFTVGGKKFTKTTSHGDDSVKENINTEAYDRLKKVFDFSDYKG